jgi:nucleotide-binding universal stress UspA family protein
MNALSDLARSCGQEGISCETYFKEGTPPEEIENFIASNNIDLLIMGAHGYNTIGRWLFGSVSDHVMKHSSCPLMIVK